MPGQDAYKYNPDDIRLGRIAYLDERSLAYPVLSTEERTTLTPRSYTWRLDAANLLNQGNRPACVGFSIAQELAARPVVRKASDFLAMVIYKEAQKRDAWPGEDYAGTSVLAGMQVAKDLGFFDAYHFAFGVDEAILAVGYKGPSVWGINWYEGMFTPDINGFIKPTGKLSGGHAILCDQVNIAEEYFGFSNSWGLGFGLQGRCKLRFEDARMILSQWGEICIPDTRN